jgi:hypothetical protein
MQEIYVVVKDGRFIITFLARDDLESDFIHEYPTKEFIDHGADLFGSRRRGRMKRSVRRRYSRFYRLCF